MLKALVALKLPTLGNNMDAYVRKLMSMKINYVIQKQITGESLIYKSIDSVMNPEEIVNYPTEFLNFLDFLE